MCHALLSKAGLPCACSGCAVLDEPGRLAAQARLFACLQGAACGVAYMFSLVLSSPAVDPTTLAPRGTILNAEKV